MSEYKEFVCINKVNEIEIWTLKLGDQIIIEGEDRSDVICGICYKTMESNVIEVLGEL